MRTFDFSPLYRSAIGFDRLYSMLDDATRTAQSQPTYPPYNIELIGEDNYRITMAIAGFDESELNIQTENNTLTISGKKEESDKERHFLHQGIAARNFEHHFQLADHVNVSGANLSNGLLHIDLVREIPEAMKPHRVPINAGNTRQKKLLEGDTEKAA